MSIFKTPKPPICANYVATILWRKNEARYKIVVNLKCAAAPKL